MRPNKSKKNLKVRAKPAKDFIPEQWKFEHLTEDMVHIYTWNQFKNVMLRKP